MRGLALFSAFVAARLVVVWGRPLEWTPLNLLACVGQDAAVAAAVAAADWLGSRFRFGKAVGITVFWAVVLYTAVNAVVARALSTPLTWPMLRAAGGPISDSIWFYANARAAGTFLFVGGAAALGLWAWRRPPEIVRVVAVTGLAVVAVAGTLAERRVDTHGLHRNAVVTLAASALPAVRARAAERDWRHSTFANPARSSLEALRGAAAGMNVVLVGLESTGAQYLRTYGAAENVMPTLEALAQSAVVFDNAYAVAPDSIRSLFSVICSRYPAFDTAPEVYARAPCASVAEAFRAAGYDTAMFHSGRFGYLGMEAVIRDRGFDLLADAGDIGGNRESSFGVDEPAAVSRMLRWVDERPANRRFFINYLPIAGHHPYEAPAPGAFGAATDIDRYRSALFEGDRSLGTLIDGLRARGLYDRTLFVLYGDHGQAFGQHDGNFGHTFFLYEENVRVPFIVALPGRLAHPVRAPSPVSLVDLAPTLLDVMGFGADTRSQGSSALDGQARTAMFFTDYGANLVGLRDGPWKFIHELGAPRSRLFHLVSDGAEEINADGSEPQRVAEYRRILEDWSAAEKARLNPASGVSGPR